MPRFVSVPARTSLEPRYMLALVHARVSYPPPVPRIRPLARASPARALTRPRSYPPAPVPARARTRARTCSCSYSPRSYPFELVPMLVPACARTRSSSYPCSYLLLVPTRARTCSSSYLLEHIPPLALAAAYPPWSSSRTCSPSFILARTCSCPARFRALFVRIRPRFLLI